MNTHASESNRLAAYMAASAAIAATGATSAAVQIVTLGTPFAVPQGSASLFNIGAIFSAPGTTWFVPVREAAGTVLRVGGTTQGVNSVKVLATLLSTNAMVNSTAGAFGLNEVPFAASLFSTVPTKYVGFRAWNGSDVHFGWLEFTLSAGHYTISRWAYEDQVGVGLLTPGAPSAVPGGAGLAALAIGAAGLRGRRRNRG
ncbi:MAG: hypothetical protein ACO4BU_09185 [Phycisphaerales bacterium]